MIAKADRIKSKLFENREQWMGDIFWPVIGPDIGKWRALQKITIIEQQCIGGRGSNFPNCRRQRGQTCLRTGDVCVIVVRQQMQVQVRRAKNCNLYRRHRFALYRVSLDLLDNLTIFACFEGVATKPARGIVKLAQRAGAQAYETCRNRHLRRNRL